MVLLSFEQLTIKIVEVSINNVDLILSIIKKSLINIKKLEYLTQNPQKIISSRKKKQ